LKILIRIVIISIIYCLSNNVTFGAYFTGTSVLPRLKFTFFKQIYSPPVSFRIRSVFVETGNNIVNDDDKIELQYYRVKLNKYSKKNIQLPREIVQSSSNNQLSPHLIDLPPPMLL